MNKKYPVISLLIIFLASLTLYGARENITIKKSGKTKGAVTFNHTQHQKRATSEGKNCKTCHHKGTLNQSCADAGCHNDPKLDRAGMRIHKTCLNMCHRQGKFKDKAPTRCNDKRCHK